MCTGVVDEQGMPFVKKKNWAKKLHVLHFRCDDFFNFLRGSTALTQNLILIGNLSLFLSSLSR